jgi:hypothetical protein
LISYCGFYLYFLYDCWYWAICISSFENVHSDHLPTLT